MLRRLAAVAVMGTCLLACDIGKPAKGGIGEESADIGADTALLKEVNAAANEVMKNSTDCAAVKAALPEATMKIQDGIAKARTVTGRQTLESLQKQIKTIGESCP